MHVVAVGIEKDVDGRAKPGQDDGAVKLTVEALTVAVRRERIDANSIGSAWPLMVSAKVSLIR